ncbi:hypothetical protein KY289_001450 [Solanum tuberosum]|nr:hypothetical protein KY289_001450 [Solanum tuberosum]
MEENRERGRGKGLIRFYVAPVHRSFELVAGATCCSEKKWKTRMGFWSVYGGYGEEESSNLGGGRRSLENRKEKVVLYCRSFAGFRGGGDRKANE